MQDEKAPHAARVSAAAQMLDRGYGRPMQALDHTSKSAVPLVSIINFGPIDDKQSVERAAELPDESRFNEPGLPLPSGPRSGPCDLVSRWLLISGS